MALPPICGKMYNKEIWQTGFVRIQVKKTSVAASGKINE